MTGHTFRGYLKEGEMKAIVVTGLCVVCFIMIGTCTHAFGEDIVVDEVNGNSPHFVTSDEFWGTEYIGFSSIGEATQSEWENSNDIFILGKQFGSKGTYHLMDTAILSTNYSS